MAGTGKGYRYNGSGYNDPTAYQAIRELEQEELKQIEQRALKSIRAIRRRLIVDGFELIGRIAIRDIKTGREFR